MNELKPCPFCGSKKVSGCTNTLNGWQTYFIICEECECLFASDNEDDVTIGDVIARYNRRAKE